MKNYTEGQLIALEKAKTHARNNQWERAYQSLLEFDREYDENLFSDFRNRGCKIESVEIEHLDAMGCSTLVVAKSRQLYWDEPPLFSINGKLVDIEPEEFQFEKQIRALIERLNILIP